MFRLHRSLILALGLTVLGIPAIAAPKQGKAKSGSLAASVPANKGKASAAPVPKAGTSVTPAQSTAPRGKASASKSPGQPPVSAKPDGARARPQTQVALKGNASGPSRAVATKPVAAKPIATKPAAAKSVATKPVAAKPPSGTKPVVGKPAVAVAASRLPVLARTTPARPLTSAAGDVAPTARAARLRNGPQLQPPIPPASQPNRAEASAPVAPIDTPRAAPLSNAELAALGSLSVGKPNTGYLVNAVRMPNDPDWVLTAPDHGYGTRESVEQLQHCLHRVHELYPGSPAVMLGSISAPHGGHLPPHKSHRTGRDADVYFFRAPDAVWNRPATRADLDLPRTWALLKCFVTEADVDLVLIDHKIQGWLEEYALSSGEPEEWVHSLFHDRRGALLAPVRHEPGHVAHMHVRFVSPNARRQGARYYDRLVASGLVKQGVAPLQHTVAKGDTLIGISKRYRIPVEAIRANNSLKSTTIRLGQVLMVQRAVELEGARDPVWVPPRRVPVRSEAVERPESEAPVTSRGNEPNERPESEAPVTSRGNEPDELAGT